MDRPSLRAQRRPEPVRAAPAEVELAVAARAVHRADGGSAPVTGLIHLFTGTQVQWLLIRMGRVPQPTQAQVHTFTSLTWGPAGARRAARGGGAAWPLAEALALERVQPGPGPSP